MPVNKEFIQNVQRGFGVNAIMNLVIFDSTREKLEEFNELIQKNLEARFKFSTQDENYEFFKDYYVASLEIIFSITFVILIVVVALSNELGQFLPNQRFYWQMSLHPLWIQKIRKELFILYLR